MNIENIVKENIEKYNLLKPEDTVVIGVSGGLDSIVLLKTIYVLSTKYYNFNIKVAHINHKIRQGTAERDSDFVKEICASLNIPFFLKEENVKQKAKELKIGEEEAGRIVRYSFFNELAGENGKILTAHHANDNAETLLLHLFRGAGLNGLCGMQFKKGNIIRPLLNIKRKDIEAYAIKNGITHIEDETNQLDIYSRNKIRLNVIPEIENNFNQNFISTVNDSMVTLSEDNDFISSFAENAINHICSYKNNVLYFDVKLFDQQHISIKKRIIILSLMRYFNIDNTYFTHSIIEQIINVFNGKNASKFILKNELSIQKEYFKVSVSKIVEKTIVNVPLNKFNGTISVENHNFLLSVNDYDSVINTTNTCHIPIKDSKNFIFRNPQKDDIFRIEDNKHKKLNRYLTDKKVPQKDRNGIIVLARDNIVYWVCGIGVTRYEERQGRFLTINNISKGDDEIDC